MQAASPSSLTLPSSKVITGPEALLPSFQLSMPMESMEFLYLLRLRRKASEQLAFVVRSTMPTPPAPFSPTQKRTLRPPPAAAQVLASCCCAAPTAARRPTAAATFMACCCCCCCCWHPAQGREMRGR